jgi:hypothetical protein
MEWFSRKTSIAGIQISSSFWLRTNESRYRRVCRIASKIADYSDVECAHDARARSRGATSMRRPKTLRFPRVAGNLTDE